MNEKWVAEFAKVSFERFLQDYRNYIAEDITLKEAEAIYAAIPLPSRASRGSAGYDFTLAYEVLLNPQQVYLLPSGIRVKMHSGYVLKLYPRSSLGIKKRLSLANTVGIIDSDYYYAANEGHIIIALVNNSKEVVRIKAGERVVQGIFETYYLAQEETVVSSRAGGLGSSGA